MVESHDPQHCHRDMKEVPKTYDIAIVGAGPAGMMAAITAAEEGANVIVLNDKAAVGGQIYRSVSQSPLPDISLLGKEYTQGLTLIERFNQSGAKVIHNSHVWHVGDNGEILFSQTHQQVGTRRLIAREIIIANGAMERPFPIEGWHLPGVMSAGSAQVMLKSDAIVCDDAVFIGTGPLLYLIVAQYIRLGVKVQAIVDTTEKINYVKAIKKAPQALSNSGLLVKGVALLNEIRAAGTVVYRSVKALKISARNPAEKGGQSADQMTFLCRDKQVTLHSEHFFLHQGVIPNINITRALGLAHHWCEQQLCWKPTLDQWGQSSVANISVAGDCSGIIGADAAAVMGQITALNLLRRLQLISDQQRNQQGLVPQRKLKQFNRFRAFIDCLYRPRDDHRIPEADAIVVCRCEERTVAQLKMGYAQGAKGPNELKGMTRCGMGPCQGRMCGHTVTELLASWRGEAVEKVGYYRLRSPMKLLNLEELAHFKQLLPAEEKRLDRIELKKVGLKKVEPKKVRSKESHK